MHGGDARYRYFAAHPANLTGKALGDPLAIGQPGDELLSHGLAMFAVNSAVLKFQIDPYIPAGEISDPVDTLIVVTSGRFTAG